MLSVSSASTNRREVEGFLLSRSRCKTASNTHSHSAKPKRRSLRGCVHRVFNLTYFKRLDHTLAAGGFYDGGELGEIPREGVTFSSLLPPSLFFFSSYIPRPVLVFHLTPYRLCVREVRVMWQIDASFFSLSYN